MFKNNHHDVPKDKVIDSLNGKIKFLSISLFFSIIFTIASVTFYAQSQYEFEQASIEARQYNAQLVEANEYLVNDLSNCVFELNQYNITKEYLMSIGASENQAIISLKAANLLGKGRPDFPKF